MYHHQVSLATSEQSSKADHRKSWNNVIRGVNNTLESSVRYKSSLECHPSMPRSRQKNDAMEIELSSINQEENCLSCSNQLQKNILVI